MYRIKEWLVDHKWWVLGAVVMVLFVLAVSPARAGSGSPAAGVCAAHVGYIENMLENGLTQDDILQNFEAWLRVHDPVSATYPDMVRAMIKASAQKGWQSGAMTECVRVMASVVGK